AIAGDAPISPKKQLVYLLGFLLGIGLPFALIYVKELLNNKVQEIKDVQQNTDVPILGEIAHDDSGEMLVVITNSRTAISEMFRLIRTNLEFMAAGQENKVILVTSSMSQEGKTFF